MTFHQAHAVLTYATGVNPLVATELLVPFRKNRRLRRAYLAGFLQSYHGDTQEAEWLGPVGPSQEPAYTLGLEHGSDHACRQACDA